jgi:hypothetical protein
MNIGEYRTVRAPDFELLDQFVNKLLAEGFQPFGSPYVVDRTGEYFFCQAMVKEAAPGKVRRVSVGGI